MKKFSLLACTLAISCLSVFCSADDACSKKDDIVDSWTTYVSKTENMSQEDALKVVMSIHDEAPSFCISCGMPMRSEKDFALGDVDKSHCVYCTEEDGSIKSRDAVLEGWATYLVNEKGLSQEDATDLVSHMLDKMSEWHCDGTCS